MRRALWTMVAALVVMGGACVPPAEETTTPERFDPETVMGEIQARGELRIGIPDDVRPFGFERRGEAAGVTADLGAYVASALNVEPAYFPVPNGDLLPMLDEGEIDVAFPITAITEPLVRHYGFTDPYWVGHQRVADGAGRFTPEELAGETVCSFIDPDTGVLLSDLEPTIEIMEGDSPPDCFTALVAGIPVTASDAILLGYVEADLPWLEGTPEIGGDDLTTEGYGAAVNIESEGLAEVINNILQRAKDDGPWQDAVDRWLEEAEPVDPPDLTVEEAAALYPANA